MKAALANQTLEIACPGCGHRSKETFKWLKQNTQLTCASGKSVAIDQSKFKAEFARAERSLADFDESLKNLFKK